MWIEDLIFRAQVRCGIAMAREAPAHVERLRLPSQRHVADWTVTLGASDTLGNVNAMVEVDIIGKGVDSRPMDRRVLCETLTIGREHRGVRPDLRMAGHADSGRRHPGI